MNIFVLCTGRCGSVTFTKACQHITNYTCTHESRVSLLGEDRLNYPPLIILKSITVSLGF